MYKAKTYRQADTHTRHSSLTHSEEISKYRSTTRRLDCKRNCNQHEWNSVNDENMEQAGVNKRAAHFLLTRRDSLLRSKVNTAKGKR